MVYFLRLTRAFSNVYLPLFCWFIDQHRWRAESVWLDDFHVSESKQVCCKFCTFVSQRVVWRLKVRLDSVFRRGCMAIMWVRMYLVFSDNLIVIERPLWAFWFLGIWDPVRSENIPSIFRYSCRNQAWVGIKRFCGSWSSRIFRRFSLTFLCYSFLKFTSNHLPIICSHNFSYVTW